MSFATLASIPFIAGNQAPMTLTVDWGDGGIETIRLEEDDPRLGRFLRNGVDPMSHPETAQILGIDDVFKRVYTRG